MALEQGFGELFEASFPGKGGASAAGDWKGQWKSLNPLHTGWTAADPNSVGQINSIAADGDGIKIVLEADDKARRFDGSSQDGLRYWKPLDGPDGNLAWSDRFTVEIIAIRTSTDANSGQDSAGFTVGLADDTIKTDVSDTEWCGMMFYNNNSSGDIQIKFGGDTSQASVAASGGIAAYCCIVPPVDNTDGDGDVKVSRVSGYLLNSSNQMVASGASADQSHEYEDGTTVNLFFGPAFLASNATDDPDNTYKVWYRVNLLASGFAPAAYTADEGLTD
jgi:hypothetical protein